MNIQIINFKGDRIALSPPIKTALDSLGLEAEKPNADWEELMPKILRALESDGLDMARLQPEVKYYDTKKGRKIHDIKVYYSQ